MNKKDISELLDISYKTESFLLQYAKGIYGKYNQKINVNIHAVKQFMKLSSKQDMLEVLKYTKHIDEMLLNKNGAEDLEDFIYYIIN